MPSSPRRRYLRRCASALGLAVAGCLGSNGTTGTASTDHTSPVERGTESTPHTESDQTDAPVVWKRPVGSAVKVSPTSTDESLFVGTQSGTVHSLAAADGNRQWSYDARTEVRASPVSAGGSVFVVTGKSDLFANQTVVALDAETGTERWTFGPEEWWLEVLGVTEEMVYVGTEDDAISDEGQTLYALSLEDGSVRWSGGIGDPSGGLLRDETIYVPSYGRLYAYDAVSGEKRWTRDVEDYSFRTIAATDETVCYVADDEDVRGTLVALDSETGETVWSHDEWLSSSTTLHDETLFVGGAHVAAFDPESGDKRWQVEESGFVPRVPVQDGVLYTGGDAVRSYDIDHGERNWSWIPDEDVEGVVPAAATSGSLFVDSWGRTDPRNEFKFGVDIATGGRRWAFEDGTELTDLSSDGRQAYAGSAKGVVYALR